jgi:hypothetical protein
MTNKDNGLEYLVLQAVANDFEEFEMIVGEIAKWTNGYQAAPDRRQIEQALMTAIAGEDIKAYEPREGHRQLVATQADPRKIHSLWFYITEQGKSRMQRLEALEHEAESK